MGRRSRRLPWRHARARGTSDDALPFGKAVPTPIFGVASMDVAVDFFERLGFDVKRYDAEYAWVLHCGWEVLHLRVESEHHRTPSTAYLHVRDVDLWHADRRRALGDAGVHSDRSRRQRGARRTTAESPTTR